MADGAPPAPPGAIQTISDSKLVAFAIGTQKKSRFQKAREEQEAKRKQNELEAAKVYESFVASFNTDEEGVKKFVRGGGDSELYRMNNGTTKPSEPDYYQPHEPQVKIALLFHSTALIIGLGLGRKKSQQAFKKCTRCFVHLPPPVCSVFIIQPFLLCRVL